jgi:Mn-containing catalase
MSAQAKSDFAPPKLNLYELKSFAETLSDQQLEHFYGTIRAILCQTAASIQDFIFNPTKRGSPDAAFEGGYVNGQTNIMNDFYDVIAAEVKSRRAAASK